MTESRHVGTIIIGAGSGNSIPSPELADAGGIVVVDAGEHFGGTCLNTGCIPTKMFVHVADVAHAARAGIERLGMTGEIPRGQWAAVRDRVFGRIDPISSSGEQYRESGERGISLIRERVRLVGEREIETASGGRVRGERLVIAAGSRPRELEAVPLGARVHTSEDIMRIPDAPASLAIIGGGTIAAEFASLFAGFGTRVTVLARAGLSISHDEDVAETFTRQMSQWCDVRTYTSVRSSRETTDGVELELSDGSTLTVDRVLVAAGRVPNTDLIGADDLGFDTTPTGGLRVDRHQRVLRSGEPVRGVYALGDIANDWRLKHVANHEARIVQGNLIEEIRQAADGREPSLRENTLEPVPAVTFSNPQVASFGVTLREARGDGIDAIEARQNYGDTAWGWALEDTDNFAKIVVDRADARIIGAHIVGPDAGMLLQQLIHIASSNTPIRGLARGQYWPHPVANEIIENALLNAEAAL